MNTFTNIIKEFLWDCLCELGEILLNAERKYR